MVAQVQLADGQDALHRPLVAQMAAQRVTGIRRVGDDAALLDDFHRFADQPRLRVFGVNVKQLGHDGLQLAATGVARGGVKRLHTGTHTGGKSWVSPTSRPPSPGA